MPAMTARYAELWRALGDSNPCYRRERAFLVTTANHDRALNLNKYNNDRHF